MGFRPELVLRAGIQNTWSCDALADVSRAMDDLSVSLAKMQKAFARVADQQRIRLAAERLIRETQNAR